MKFRNKLLTLCMVYALCSCTNSNSSIGSKEGAPTGDAKLVCDCITKVNNSDLNYSEASKASKKCTDLAIKMTLRYSDNPQQLKEYNTLLNECLNDPKNAENKGKR